MFFVYIISCHIPSRINNDSNRRNWRLTEKKEREEKCETVNLRHGTMGGGDEEKQPQLTQQPSQKA